MPLVSLRSRLSRIRAALMHRLRPEPIEIELDIVEQLIVQHLLRVDQASFGSLVDAVLAARPTANQQQVRLSLIRFESFRLIQRILHPELDSGQQMSFTLTSDGRRLRAVIPAQPQSRIQTWL